MKTIKTALAYVLLLAMLLSSFGGFAYGAAEATVSVDRQTVFDPLAEAQSVAYERHGEGYEVSLDRDADGVTMHVSAVPGATAAEQASLYIRTGVTPGAGKTYRVSYTLAAEQAIDEYVVCFDGARENAYGAAEQRSVAAGGADPARFLLTSEAESGELILRLLLGKTPVNTLRFSDLTVEEATEEEIAAGTNTVLVDRLNLNAPGSVSMWANDDCGAKLTAAGETATLTVTEVPKSGAEVWKIKLFVHTGVMPEAGKTYRFRADVTSTASRTIEVCYNEGETEKGYAVLYNQSLWNGTQTMSRLIYIPAEKTNAGELVFQLSLGKLQKGDRVTISGISVEEMIPTYKNALASDFAFDTTNIVKFQTKTWDVQSASPVSEKVNLDAAATVWKSGSRAEELNVVDGAVTLNVAGHHDAGYDESWRANLFIHTGVRPNGEGDDFWRFFVRFKIRSEQAYGYTEVKCGLGDDDAHYGGTWGLRIPAGETVTVVQPCNRNGENGEIVLTLQLGATAEDNVVTVSDIAIERPPALDRQDREETDNDMAYAIAGDNCAFDFNDGCGSAEDFAVENGVATLTCTGNKGNSGDGWSDSWWRKVFFRGGCEIAPGSYYQVHFDMTVSGTDDPIDYTVKYNRSGANGESFYGMQDHIARSSGDTGEVWLDFGRFYATESGTLELQFEFGLLPAGTKVEISNIRVKEWKFPRVTYVDVDRFNSAWETAANDMGYYTTSQTKTADDVTMTVDCSSATTRADWMSKLFIRTGVVPQGETDYRVSFELHSEADQLIHVFLNRGDRDDDKQFGDLFNIPVKADDWTEVSVTTRARRMDGCGSQLTMQLMLGMIPEGTNTNTFAVRNIRVEEVDFWTYSAQVTGTVDNDMQPGYSVPLTRAKDSACVSINKTPDTGREAWKSKLFVNTDVSVKEGETCLVRMDVLAENDMNYEVCYNCGGIEKGFDAMYDLRAAGGRTQTLERLFTAERSGKLTIQLSLGNVPAPNRVTVSNVVVEKANYTSGGSALPEPLAFRGSSAVSYWAHADYETRLTGTDDAITMHILKAPGFGAEPWKIKLFLDTETPLKAGKYYRVTTDLLAKSPQNVEICYNSGGAEMGYDAMGGIRLAAGVKQTVEKLVAVPADKTDGKNLMLQINLGAATSPNEITVSGVTVEEVSLRADERMAQGFSYQKNSAVRTSPDIEAKLDATNSTSTICITSAPASGAEVWMAQLLVHTGVVLSAGKSYVVRANLVSEKNLTYELCFNNEETEKGFDVLYGQSAQANVTAAIDKKISVPASMTDAGELVLQFSVGGPGANNVTVANVSVQEIRYGSHGARNLTPAAAVSEQGALDLGVTREAITGRVNAANGAIRVAGAALCAGERYEAAFTGRADAALTGTLTLRKAGAARPVLTQRFELSPEAKPFAFTTAEPLEEGGAYELLWQFDGSGTAELSGVSLSIPAEQLTVKRSDQKVTVNGVAVTPDAYNINGYNYFKLRDLALLLNDTDAQFVVRYNAQDRTVSLTTGKRYTPVGGELVRGSDRSASCTRGIQELLVNGRPVRLKAYNLGCNNYFKLRDLDDILGFRTDYIEATDTVAITSPLTPEAQEASYAYGTFFRPEIDSESQPYVGDPMAFYENGTYYIYYLKEGGDSINHSVYLTTTIDFASYTEYDKPVLSASRGDAQDSWIGTGSVTKADDAYYFFYTGYNSSGVREYHEKIMVAKGSSPTSFEKVGGWEITPPASLGQKNDFRDPQAYYDPATGTISLTVTASQDGVARILKYTLDKNLQNVSYDGIIFTDPSGKYWNLECSDTFQIGGKWYLTYSGQEDTLWYATADARFGPYSAPVQLDGKVFYAAKHVENGSDAYMVGWARRSESASSTQEVAGWGGNLAVQKLARRADGSLALVPVDSITASFSKPKAVDAASVTLTAGADYSFRPICTSEESFMLTGEFTCTGTGSFGLAFDFNGKEEAYKLISVNPKENTLSLAFNEGVTKIAETPAKLGTKHSFTYIQDGSVGIFYVDQVASLTVRIYGATGKPVCLFAQDNSVSFTSLRCFTK